MNFSYGVIAAVGILVAISIGLIASSPDSIIEPRVVSVDDKPTKKALPMAVTVSLPEGSGVPGCEETNECYIPYEVTVAQGATVTWSNDDSAAHTVTSGTPEEGPDGHFDSSLFMAGATFEHTFDEAGTYDYFCMVHPWMQGIVYVEAEGEVHEDEHDDEMMEMAEDMTEGTPSATGMLSDGTEVKIWADAPVTGMPAGITIEFVGAEHVNHDIMVTQGGETVLDDRGAHHHEGKGLHSTEPLNNMDPVEITVIFQGYGVSDPKTGPIGEEIVFTNVVPEFGTIAAMILVVAIVSIIAVTAKSRISLTPRL